MTALIHGVPQPRVISVSGGAPQPTITVDGVPVTVRAASADDIGYIVACTLKSARPRVQAHTERDRRSLASLVRHLVQTADAVVAHDARDAGRLVGFALGTSGDAPHWVYVSAAFRGHGIARLLVSFLMST